MEDEIRGAAHTQLKTTQRYAHLSQATLLEAVEVVVEAAGLTVEMLE